jgi:hypothetical protein
MSAWLAIPDDPPSDDVLVISGSGQFVAAWLPAGNAFGGVAGWHVHDGHSYHLLQGRPPYAYKRLDTGPKPTDRLR